jgi:hypothetical protein
MIEPKIYVARHRGMVDSAIVHTLKAKNKTDIIASTLAELDFGTGRGVQSFADVGYA